MARKTNAVPPAETTENVETQKTKAEKVKIHPALTFYDKWEMKVTPLKKEEDKGARKFILTAIEAKRTNIKLTENEAANLNIQSHNSGFMYFPAGSITNGHKEEITINE